MSSETAVTSSVPVLISRSHCIEKITLLFALVSIVWSIRRGRDVLPSRQDEEALQWRTNLSFSPAVYTRDGLEHDTSDDESHRFGLYSSTSRRSETLESCLWASNSSASGGIEQDTVPITNNSKPQCLDEEKNIDRESTASFSSLLKLSQPTTASRVTPSKQPLSHAHCSYPRVFCNPVSDCENPELHHPQEDAFTDPVSSFMTSTINNQGSQVEEASSNSSNSTSSNDNTLLDVERFNETQAANQRLEPGSVTQVTQHRCGVCKKLLSQKSPWCSHKILRSGDMPAAGVFPCHHVYHVECLDKVTPTSQTRDPSCPACSNTIGAIEHELIAPETLQQALRSLRRSHTALGSELLSTDNQTRQLRRRHKWEKLSCCLNISFLSSS
uniref:RING-type domain-containing protein n=1 Tax=Brassica campestris TaxID=3711 RepID=M4CD66_BRACM